MAAKRRSGIITKVRKGLRDPTAAWRYVRRYLRNRRIARVAGDDHIAFYRGVMASDVTSKTPYGAVGTEDRTAWLELGKRQFDYLIDHGLRPEDRMLEIGCGNLRAGWRFIEFLGDGAYTGVDISPEILAAAEATLVEWRLKDKHPRLLLVDDMSFRMLPDGHFDVVHAHSVFSHCPIDVVEAALVGVRRVIRPDGFFDFTYNESADATYWGTLREDWFYPTEMLIDLAARHGFRAKRLSGWVHPQAKLRLRPELPG
jgi:SAM-dependent methyltransferase